MYQTDHPRDPGIFTVSDLNRRAKQMLEVSFASVRVLHIEGQWRAGALCHVPLTRWHG